MTITYWTGFWKRRNSTLLPSTQGAEIEVQLKHPTSWSTPHFILVDTSSLYLREICYVQWYNRYYFVTDVTFLDGSRAEVSCQLDVLASYKTQIGGMMAFVSRTSDQRYYETMLEDSALSMKYGVQHTAVENGVKIPGLNSAGSYLIRTTGQSSGGSSIGITTYATNAAGIESVLNFLFSENNYDFLTDTSVKSFFNPFQYIVDVQWWPFEASRFGSERAPLKLGWWNSGVNCTVVNQISIGWGEQALYVPPSQYSDFRSMSPLYTDLSIFFPGSGLYKLCPSQFPEGEVGYTYTIDVATGQALIELKAGDHLVAVYPGQMCTQVQIGQISLNLLDAGKSVLSAGSDLLKGNLLGAGVDAIEGIQSLLQPTQSVNGNMGNTSSIVKYERVFLTRLDYGSMEYPTEQYGRPCKKNLLIRNMRGFIQCERASLEANGPISEREQVNSFLNGGFFYE